jgi:RNA polymerase sigma-70 factor, ECF subfamily
MKAREEMFSMIHREFRHKIYRLCYAFIYDKEEADDLYQEIMANIWNSLDSFRGDSALGTWVYRVSMNSALFYNRRFRNYYSAVTKASNQKTEDMELPEAEKENPEDKFDELARAISKLEKQDRLIISLVLEGLSYDEIADIAGITPNYTGVKINRIKKQLKEIIHHGRF